MNAKKLKPVYEMMRDEVENEYLERLFESRRIGNNPPKDARFTALTIALQTVESLRRIAKTRELKSTGRRSDLIQRIVVSIEGQ